MNAVCATPPALAGVQPNLQAGNASASFRFLTLQPLPLARIARSCDVTVVAGGDASEARRRYGAALGSPSRGGGCSGSDMEEAAAGLSRFKAK